MNQTFKAYDYNSDDSFSISEYSFEGDEKEGWKIFRNGKLYLEVEGEYKLLKTVACGVCSTDLDRRFLPFPLPQVIGHELVAKEPKTGKKYAVEINDTLLARGAKNLDKFCTTGIPTHSPSRMVLGIDRLPGGFGPYILAPKNAMVDVDRLSDTVSVLTEPFAAALQAVTSFPPRANSEVAVLGPRRLGSLIIGALSIYRKTSGIHFKIVSLVRHNHLIELSKKLGADEVIDLRKDSENIKNRFDIVYDTTASPQGFEKAIEYSSGSVHLKSTNGQVVCGIKKMTDLVVDEISILPYSEENLNFHWDKKPYQNNHIYVSQSLKEKIPTIFGKNVYHPESPEEIREIFNSNKFKDRLPRFDLAIVSTLEEIDFVVRPYLDSEESLLRPRGAILFSGETQNNPLLQFINSGKKLHSSRCGDFHEAIRLLEEYPDMAENISNNMISHVFESSELPGAFEMAKQSSSIKVIIKYDE